MGVRLGGPTFGVPKCGTLNGGHHKRTRWGKSLKGTDYGKALCGQPRVSPLVETLGDPRGRSNGGHLVGTRREDPRDRKIGTI
jgi:hypothetical protein